MRRGIGGAGQGKQENGSLFHPIDKRKSKLIRRKLMSHATTESPRKSAGADEKKNKCDENAM